LAPVLAHSGSETELHRPSAHWPVRRSVARIAAASAAIPARPEVQAAVDPAARAVAEALLETPGDRAPPRFAGSGHGPHLLGDMFAERRKDRRRAPYADRRLASRRQ